MGTEKDSAVLTLLQPDLFSTDALITVIQSRCPRLQNLETAPRERLLKIYRQMILPLPQRLYRTNRRGKILTARRAKAGLESKPSREGEKPSFKTMEKNATKRSLDDRLKPPPDSTRPAKIRIGSEKYSDNRSTDLDKIVINDRRRNHDDREKREERKDNERDRYSNHDTSSSRKIVLKRSSSSSSSERRSSPSRSSEPSSKKHRTAIKWP